MPSLRCEFTKEHVVVQEGEEEFGGAATVRHVCRVLPAQV